MPTMRCVIGCLLVSTLAAYAQAPQSWQNEVGKLKTRFHDEIANKITIEYVATQNGLTYPLKTNKITHQEIEEKAYFSAKHYVNQTIPEINQKMAFDIISEKYRQWTHHERISFIDIRGKKYDGYITGVYPNIRINGIIPPFVDLPDEVKVHFDQELASSYSDQESLSIVRKNIRDRNRLFKEYKQKEEKRLYVFNDFTNCKGTYYTKDKAEQQLENYKLKIIDTEYAAGIESFLNENGYALFDGDYLPAAMARQKENARQEAQRQQQAEQERLRLEREAEQARLATQQEQLRQQQEAERKAQEAQYAQAAKACATSVPTGAVGWQMYRFRSLADAMAYRDRLNARNIGNSDAAREQSMMGGGGSSMVIPMSAVTGYKVTADSANPGYFLVVPTGKVAW